jgi:hypothetical protein
MCPLSVWLLAAVHGDDRLRNQVVEFQRFDQVKFQISDRSVT